MIKEIKYKLQGDGRDSWEITEKDNQGNIINKYMVYEDPEKQKLGTALQALMNAKPEEIEQIKQFLGINN